MGIFNSFFSKKKNKVSVLKGICGCDRCGKDVKKGEGALNNRNSRIYCKDCWQQMKSLDPGGQELPLSETWERAVERTNLNWT